MRAEVGKRVAHVTTVHPRGDLRILRKECVTLSENGLSVSLIVADGHGDANVSNVNVRDIGRRSASRIKRALFDTFKAMREALKQKPAVIHIHDPELLLAVWLPLLRGVPVVYDIHEDTRNQILIKKYIPAAARKTLSRLFGCFEDFICRRISGLVVPQKTMHDHFSSLNGNCIELPNYVDINLYPNLRKSFARPILFHAGALTPARGLMNMIGLANELGDRGDVYVAGPISGGIEKSEFGRLKYLGELSYEEVLSHYQTANIGIILYNNVGQYYMASAVKSFEYMAAGMPIVMPNFGEWPEFARRTACAINVDVGNAAAVVDSIMMLCAQPEFAANLAERGRAYVEQEGCWQAVSGRLLVLYENIIGDN